MHVFCDLDGVLSDFIQAACDLHRPGQSDEMVLARGRAIDPNAHPFKQLELGLGVSTDAFWEGITAAGEAFWTDMAVLPFAKELWRCLNEARPGHVSILTSPGAGVAAAASSAGKYRWVLNHLGEDAPYRTIICPAPLKHHLAVGADGPNLLIDDYDVNIKRWVAAGGHAMQWPALQFHDRHATIADVDKAQRASGSGTNLVIGGAV